MPSKPIHFVASSKILSFYMAFYIVYIYYVFFIHLSVEGHLGHFQVLDMVNSASVKIVIHASFWISVSWI